MKRALKETKPRNVHYAKREEFAKHLERLSVVLQQARPLRTSKGQLSTGFILESWQNDPQRFNHNPNYYLAQLNSWSQ